MRQIFERYLELGSVRLLKRDLDRRGIVSAVKASKNGNSRGGKPFSRGALYHLLSNPIYIGEIRHKNERHPGQHEAIVSRELWERVQQRLRDRAVRRAKAARPRRREVRWRASCSMKTASRCTCRERPKASAAIAITSLENWSEANRKMQSMGGEYPRPRLSDRSLPPLKNARRPRCDRAGGRGGWHRRESAAVGPEVRSSVDRTAALRAAKPHRRSPS